jgi:hypothetical protein
VTRRDSGVLGHDVDQRLQSSLLLSQHTSKKIARKNAKRLAPCKYLLGLGDVDVKAFGLQSGNGLLERLLRGRLEVQIVVDVGEGGVGSAETVGLTNTSCKSVSTLQTTEVVSSTKSVQRDQ